MPRYYFHLYNDIDALDNEGKEFPDAAAARAYAEKESRNMIAVSVLEQGKVNLHHRIEVADENAQIVAVVEFGDVLTVES